MAATVTFGERERHQRRVAKSGQMTAWAEMKATIQEWRIQSRALVPVRRCTSVVVAGGGGKFDNLLVDLHWPTSKH